MCPADPGAAARAAAAVNAAALVAAGGVPLLADTVAAAHEASERPAPARAPHRISASSAAEEVREWYYYPAAQQAQQAHQAADGSEARPRGGGSLEDGRAGPVTKAELRRLAGAGAVSLATAVWASGMAEALPLGAVRELRWWLARKQGVCGGWGDRGRGRASSSNGKAGKLAFGRPKC